MIFVRSIANDKYINPGKTVVPYGAVIEKVFTGRNARAFKCKPDLRDLLVNFFAACKGAQPAGSPTKRVKVGLPTQHFKVGLPTSSTATTGNSRHQPTQGPQPTATSTVTSNSEYQDCIIIPPVALQVPPVALPPAQVLPVVPVANQVVSPKVSSAPAANPTPSYGPSVSVPGPADRI